MAVLADSIKLSVCPSCIMAYEYGVEDDTPMAAREWIREYGIDWTLDVSSMDDGHFAKCDSCGMVSDVRDAVMYCFSA